MKKVYAHERKGRKRIEGLRKSCARRSLYGSAYADKGISVSKKSDALHFKHHEKSPESYAASEAF
ncbi:hypothetical protein [Alloprevotella tannerae]|uniref:Uncharacterized protein n=1 Tax=Alloprevotella tannerae ATCC 51259 TaxID=626522 RepID=C9LIS1_9BACT|nr:hypothetical protein [Alloprevotella tannerae]EEX70888.1 hypothetical protein GCWU000325_02130 [Alloprevotella tannerae ATCC 51259]